MNRGQIFKKIVDPCILFDFLKENSDEIDNYYVFSKMSYKKIFINNNIIPFFNTILPYYQESKKYFITRKMDYSKFTTIIRQLCNSMNINYSKEIIYNYSNYEIIYKIKKYI